MKNALVTITVAFLFCSILMAQGDGAIHRTTLKGLTGVFVVVALSNPDAEKDGLSQDQIQTDVELHLRMAGIRVLTTTEYSSIPHFSRLEINLATIKMELTPNCAYHLSVRLYQDVSLLRDPRIWSDAPTWGAEGIGVVGTSKTGTIRDDIKDSVDKFINAWLSVNPKH